MGSDNAHDVEECAVPDRSSSSRVSSSAVEPASALQPLLNLATVRAAGIGVLDGGFATHLEDALGKDLSQSPLWSASLLADEQEGCKAIKQSHWDFLEAGAHIISTSTYQASFLTLSTAGFSRGEAGKLILRSVDLAIEARDEWLHEKRVSKNDDEANGPLIALSMGPYGAALSNGAEYTGEYDSPTSNDVAASPQNLEDFHYERLAAIADSSATWQNIDLLAFETLPRIDEARAIRRALARLYRASPTLPHKAALASFVFPALPQKGESRCVPFDASASLSGAITTADTMKQIVDATLAADAEKTPAFHALGINCTKPATMARLIGPLTSAVSEMAPSSRPLLFIYPDGGLVWDGIARVWTQPEANTSEAGGSDRDTTTWTSCVLQAADDAMSRNEKDKDTPWAACFVGGCCKSTASDVRALRDLVDARA